MGPRPVFDVMEADMDSPDWVTEFPAAVTVCDTDGIILHMNDRAADLFSKAGGFGLIGRNVLDCHPAKVHSSVKHHLESRETYILSVRENDRPRIVYGAPWYIDGEYRGFVELSFDIVSKIQVSIR